MSADQTTRSDERLDLDPETQKRLREDAFRRAAYALVESDLRGLDTVVDIRIRRTSALVEVSRRRREEKTLIDAVDSLIERRRQE